MVCSYSDAYDAHYRDRGNPRCLQTSSPGFIYVLLSKIFTISCVLAAVYVSGASAVNAIIGLVLAYAMTSFVGFRLMYRPFKDIAVLQSCISIKDIFSYSIPVFNASVYGFIIGSASQFFVSRYFGVAEFAQFANGFMELPFAGVIIAVIASVMLPEFSRMYAAGTAKEEYILLWNRTVFQFGIAHLSHLDILFHFRRRYYYLSVWT